MLWAVFKPRTLSQDDQYLVRTLLREADRMVESGDLLTPPGANAFEDLQKVLQKDPEKTGPRTARKIAGLLRADAEKSVAAGDLEAASEKANQALLVAPEDAEVQALVKRISEEQEHRASPSASMNCCARPMRRKAATSAAVPMAPMPCCTLPSDSIRKTRVQAKLKALTDAEFGRVRGLLDDDKTDAAAQALESCAGNSALIQPSPS